MLRRVHPYQLVKVVALFTFAGLTMLGLIGGLAPEVIVLRAGVATSTVILCTLLVLWVLKTIAVDQ